MLLWNLQPYSEVGRKKNTILYVQRKFDIPYTENPSNVSKNISLFRVQNLIVTN